MRESLAMELYHRFQQGASIAELAREMEMPAECIERRLRAATLVVTSPGFNCSVGRRYLSPTDGLR
jgi:hypothetical protein